MQMPKQMPTRSTCDAASTQSLSSHAHAQESDSESSDPDASHPLEEAQLGETQGSEWLPYQCNPGPHNPTLLNLTVTGADTRKGMSESEMKVCHPILWGSGFFLAASCTCLLTTITCRKPPSQSSGTVPLSKALCFLMDGKSGPDAGQTVQTDSFTVILRHATRASGVWCWPWNSSFQGGLPPRLEPGNASQKGGLWLVADFESDYQSSQWHSNTCGGCTRMR